MAKKEFYRGYLENNLLLKDFFKNYILYGESKFNIFITIKDEGRIIDRIIAFFFLLKGDHCMSKANDTILVFGKEEFEWDWSDRFNCKLAIVGGDSISHKQELLKSITDEIITIDPKSIFRIGCFEKDISDSVEKTDYFNLIEFESEPTIESNLSLEFNTKRMEFVQLLLKAYSLILQKPRTELIPLASYKKNIEGPLKGYIRAIEKMEDGTNKEWLLNQIKSLETVKWSYESGYNYYIDGTKTEEIILLELLKGLWSFWALTSTLIEEQQMLLVIDLPGKLTNLNTMVEIKEIVRSLLSIITDLSDEITLSLVISTETLAPIPELNIRHQLFLNYQSEDFDWNNNESYFSPNVISKWKASSFEDALWMDMAIGERIDLSHIQSIKLRNRN